MAVDTTKPRRPGDKTARIGRAARYALAGIRIVNGSVALVAPSAIIRRFGESPADDNAAVYGLLLVLFIIFLPKGILGSLLDAVRRRRQPVVAVPKSQAVPLGRAP